VIKRPSRTACDRKRDETMKFVAPTFFASSSIRNGWTFFEHCELLPGQRDVAAVAVDLSSERIQP
jgi:hypothetical protein